MIKRYNRISLVFGAAGVLLIYGGPFISIFLIPVRNVRLAAAILVFAGAVLLHFGFVYYAKAKGAPARVGALGWLSPWLLYFTADKTVSPDEQAPPSVPWGSRLLLYLSIFAMFLAHVGIALGVVVIGISLVQLVRQRRTANHATKLVLTLAMVLAGCAVVGWSFAIALLRI